MTNKERNKLLKEHKQVEKLIDSCIIIINNINQETCPFTYRETMEDKDKLERRYILLCNILKIKNKYYMEEN
jgi:hypothetical protein